MRNLRLCSTPALGALLAIALPAAAAGVTAPGAADGALPPWCAPPSTLVEVIERTLRDPDQSRWAREIRHDPLAVLSGVTSPALVIYGSADPWVPVQTSVERLRATAARHPNLDVAVITGADHAMATNVTLADQIDPHLMTQAAPQSAEYFGVLGAWLARQAIATVT